MKKTWIAAAIACALVSMGVGAESLNVESGDIYLNDFEGKTAADSFSNSGKVTNTSIILKGGTFVNTGTIETGTLQLLQTPSSGNNFGGTITATTEIVYQGVSQNKGWYSPITAVLNTPKLVISDSGDTAGTGLAFTDSEQLIGVDSISVESLQTRTGLYLVPGSDTVRYDGTVNLTTSSGTKDARISVETAATETNQAHVYVKQVISNVAKGLNNTNKLQTSNAGSGGPITFEIGSITIKSGKLNIQTESNTAKDSNHGGTFILNEVNLQEGTSLRASVYEYNNNPVTPELRIEGSPTFYLGKGAGVDFGGWKDAANKDWRPDLVTLAAESITINIENSSSKNWFYVTKFNRETSASDIYVIADAMNNTGDAVADLEKLADVVKTNYKDEEKNNHLECLPGVQLEQQASDLYDAAYGEVGEGMIDEETGDCINCGVTNVRTVANPNVNGIAEMTALGLHVWRNEIDDMHRRLGELRDSSADANGLWTRIYNGKASFGGQDITNKYTAFQFGYDHQVTPGFWLGGAMSYTYGDNDFRYGGGDSNLLAFTGYGSWLWDSGIYLDVTGKIGRMKNSFDIALNDIRSSGDYHTNAVSVSAELGWRFYPLNNVFVEPQLEMWYGHVFDAQYETSTGVSVDQASTESLVGRAGVKLGIKCPNDRGSAFIKASVLHDWQGDADFRFGKSGAASRTISEELGGTWYEYGIGADLNATKQLHFWADLERGEGGEVDTDYRMTIGMRYSY